MAKVLKTTNMNKCIGCFTCKLVCAAFNHQNHSITRSSIQIRTSGGMTGKFVATVCLACNDERACMEACPTHALSKRKGGGVIFDPDLCIGCQKCKEACIVGAINFVPEDTSPIVCKHCGVCARYCPHECLKMEDVGDVE